MRAQTSHPSNAARRAQQAWLQGQQLVKQERWDDAVSRFRSARSLQPSDVLYHLNLSHALIKSGNHEQALEAATAAAELEPSNAIARGLRIQALAALRRNEDTAALLEATPPEQMDHDLWVRLGVAQVHLGRAQQAVGSFLQALALKPAEGSVHYRLGLTFNELALKREAAECLRTALLLNLGPLEVGVRDLLTFYEREVCDWAQSEPGLLTLREAVRALPEDAAIQTTPFAHVTLIADADEQLRAARSCARFHARSIAPLPRRAAQPREKLRVGYVSADIRQHATSYLMAELFERHDRSRFEVFIYSHGAEDESAVCRRIRAAAHQFVPAQKMTPGEIAQRIRADGIDLLVDLKGYTRDALPGIFAYGAAPVQIAYLGFPGTSGAECIDYIVGDPFVTPLAHAAHYSEKIAQLPGCYQCNDGTRALPVAPTRASQGLPEQGLVLCGFNQPYKISPEVFDVWCRLLLQTPGSVLWLLEWNREAPIALRREAAARGINPERLVFAKTVPQAEHLDRVACADLFLDTWPCNAHTTASDALWAGVPIVTWSGETFASRVAGSLLHAVGMPELVCVDVARYETLALQLTQDAPRREALRERIRAARSSSPLFSSAELAPQLEALYDRMWARALAGLPPEHLAAA